MIRVLKGRHRGHKTYVSFASEKAQTALAGLTFGLDCSAKSSMWSNVSVMRISANGMHILQFLWSSNTCRCLTLLRFWPEQTLACAVTGSPDSASIMSRHTAFHVEKANFS